MVLLRPRLLPEDLFDDGNEERQSFATSRDGLDVNQHSSTHLIFEGIPHLNNYILVPHEEWDTARLDGGHAMETHA